MVGHVEVDHEKELKAIIHERQAGVDKFEHVTMIAGAVSFERLRVTSFLEAQGQHGNKLEEIDRKVDGLDRKVDRLEREMRQGFAAVDKRFDTMDQRFEAVDQRFDTMERRIVAAVDAQLDKFTDRVLKGVAAQLEAHKVPVGEGERRGYRS